LCPTFFCFLYFSLVFYTYSPGRTFFSDYHQIHFFRHTNLGELLVHTCNFSISRLPKGLQQLFYAWSHAQSYTALPLLTKIDVTALGLHLDLVVITEILRGPDDTAMDFQFIYVGRGQGRSQPEPVAGKFLSTLEGKGPGSHIWNAYRYTSNVRQPVLASLPFEGTPAHFTNTLELFLPVRSHRESTTLLILVGVKLLTAAEADRQLQQFPELA
jgi:hypothetical protein